MLGGVNISVLQGVRSRSWVGGHSMDIRRMSWRGEANRGWLERIVRPVRVERVQRVDEGGRRSGVGVSVQVTGRLRWVPV